MASHDWSCMYLNFGWPQWVVVAMYAYNIIYSTINNGEQREPYNGPTAICGVAISAIILYFGGFWGGGN